jgi:hypothetical protein
MVLEIIIFCDQQPFQIVYLRSYPFNHNFKFSKMLINSKLLITYFQKLFYNVLTL